jgi:hypothetical protein
MSVQHLVATLMRLPEPAQEDASDALAIALTHAFHVRGPAAIQACAAQSRLGRKGSRGAWQAVLKARGLA